MMNSKKSEIDKYTSSEIINRIETSAEIVVSFIIFLMKNFTLIVVNCIVALYFMISISLTMTLVSLMVFPLTIIITNLFKNAVYKARQDFLSLHDSYLGFLYRTFENIDGIKSFRIEEKTSNSLKSLLYNFSAIYSRQINISANKRLTNEFLFSLFNLVILYIASLFIWENRITLGNLMTFTLYLEMLFGVLASINSLHAMLQENAANLERLYEMENITLEESSDECVDIGSINSVDLRNIHFTYANGIEALKGVTFNINKPGWYSIVGNNGCGKTTLFKLLLKFYDLPCGEIMYNNKRIQEITHCSTRSQIAYIAKSNFYLEDTIENNLLIVNAKANESDMLHVLEMVGLKDVLSTLENDSENILSLKHSRLSSGQMQKLMFSRALLTDAAVILLDEVTSDLDSFSEYEIAKIIRSLAKTKIVISIAHRLPFIEPSDEVLFMHDGIIKFRGKHSELSVSAPEYRYYFTQLARDKSDKGEIAHE